MRSAFELDDKHIIAFTIPENLISSVTRATGFFPQNSCRVVFLVLGTGSLLTFNSFLSCIDYFDEVNPEVANVSGLLAAANCTALFVVTFLLLPISTFSKKDDHKDVTVQQNCTEAIRTENRQHNRRCSFFQPSSRVAIGFSLIILVLFGFLMRPNPPSITALLLFCVSFGTFDAIVQSGLYTFAASYHEPTYSAAATLGIALSGVFSNILRLATKGMFRDGDEADENSLRQGAYLSLWLCFGFVIVCTIISIVMATERNAQEKAILAGGTVGEVVGRGHVEHSDSNYDVTQNDNDFPSQDHSAQYEIPPSKQTSSRDLRSIYIQTLAVTWKPTLSVFLNLFFTLALFPATIVSIPSSDVGLSLGSWLEVTLLLSFNVGDCVGRAVFWVDYWPFYSLLMNHRQDDEIYADTDRGEGENETEAVSGHDLLINYNMMVWRPTLGRLVFFPLFALCVIPKEPHPYIHLDFISIMIVFFFGLSNGYIHCANFTCTPTMVEKEDDRNAASLLLVLATSSGLTLGSYFGLILSSE